MKSSDAHDSYREFIARSAQRLSRLPDTTISLLSGRRFIDLQPHFFQVTRQGRAEFGLPCHEVADDLIAACSMRRPLSSRFRSFAVRTLNYLLLLIRLTLDAWFVLPWIRRKLDETTGGESACESMDRCASRPQATLPPQASIVVLSYNRLLYLKSTIRAVLDTVDLQRHELIVVDNGSHDGSVDFLRKLHRNKWISKLVLLRANQGISAGYNLGFAVADAHSEYLMKLDSDIRVLADDWLDQAIAFLSATPDVGFVALNQVNHGCIRVLPHGRVGGNDVMDFSGWPCGSAIVIPRRVRDDVGCFVEDASLTYAPDDIDYYVRASRKGYRVFFLRNATAYHQCELDKSVYRNYDKGKPRGESAALALRLARDYDRGVRPLELHYDKYQDVVVPEDGLLIV